MRLEGKGYVKRVKDVVITPGKYFEIGKHSEKKKIIIILQDLRDNM